MTKLKGILLTEGMHGMISQVEGLAKALDINYSHHTVETKGFWKVIPPKLTPISDSVFKKIECEDVDLIISCGRKSIIPSLFLKKNSKKKVFNIHIQNPKIKLDNFDLVVVPEHDNLDGHNVLKTKGAIHYLTSEEIEKNKNLKKSIHESTVELWDFCKKELQSGENDQIILDEIFLAIDMKIIDKDDLISTLENRFISGDVILTGTDIPKDLLLMANQITELRS